MNPRYPDLEIRLSSDNPFAWVSAIRQAMRHSGIGEEVISAFTDDALQEREPSQIREICTNWAEIKTT